MNIGEIGNLLVKGLYGAAGMETPYQQNLKKARKRQLEEREFKLKERRQAETERAAKAQEAFKQSQLDELTGMKTRQFEELSAYQKGQLGLGERKAKAAEEQAEKVQERFEKTYEQSRKRGDINQYKAHSVRLKDIRNELSDLETSTDPGVQAIKTSLRKEASDIRREMRKFKRAGIKLEEEQEVMEQPVAPTVQATPVTFESTLDPDTLSVYNSLPERSRKILQLAHRDKPIDNTNAIVMEMQKRAGQQQPEEVTTDVVTTPVPQAPVGTKIEMLSNTVNALQPEGRLSDSIEALKSITRAPKTKVGDDERVNLYAQLLAKTKPQDIPKLRNFVKRNSRAAKLFDMALGMLQQQMQQSQPQF